MHLAHPLHQRAAVLGGFDAERDQRQHDDHRQNERKYRRDPGPSDAAAGQRLAQRPGRDREHHGPGERRQEVPQHPHARQHHRDDEAGARDPLRIPL